MTDIHTHILFGMDDGAKTPEDSVKLLEAEAAQGVKNVICTPHFDPLSQRIDNFTVRRDAAAEVLKEELARRGVGISLKTGAEVLYSEPLLNFDSLDSLCFSDSQLMLVELPYESSPDAALVKHIANLAVKFDITPVIAHCERIKGILLHAGILGELRAAGCIIQLNASSLSDSGISGGGIYGMAARLILKRGYADVIASDCHNIERRPPDFANAEKTVSRKYGAEVWKALCGEADRMFAAENRTSRAGIKV